MSHAKALTFRPAALFSDYAMDLRLYLKKRKVAASSSANPEIIVVEGEGDRQEMVLYARFLGGGGSVVTSFLKIIELNDGRAETVEGARLGYLMENSIPLIRLVRFGSDGAAAMIGRISGVAKRLKHKQPVLNSIHCVAHRLALAAGQAGEKVPFPSKSFKPTLRQLAVGLSKVVKWYKFIASLYLMCDTLPIVSRLSRLFQVATIDMSVLHKHVTTTLEGLQLLLSTDGEYLHKFDSDLTSSLASCGITFGGASDPKQHFKSEIRQPFLTAIIDNVNEHFPDTEVLERFEILNPLNRTAEEATQSHFGEESVKKLANHYGNGGTPIVNSDLLENEWL